MRPPEILNLVQDLKNTIGFDSLNNNSTLTLARAGALDDKQKLSNIVDRLWEAKFLNDTLETYLRFIPKGIKTVPKGVSTLTWEIMLNKNSYCNIINIDNVPAKIVPGQKFELTLNKNLYKSGDILSNGNPTAGFRLRIEDNNPKVSKNGYTWIVQNNTQNTFLKAELKIGAKIIKVASSYSEGSSYAGSVAGSKKISAQDSLGKIKKTFRITGDALNAKVKDGFMIGIGENSEKVASLFFSYVEANALMEFKKEKNYELLYSRKSTPDVIDKSTNFEVKSFNGLHAKLEASPSANYTNFSTSLLKSFIMDNIINRSDFSSKKTIIGMTGNDGLTALDNAVKREAGNGGFVSLGKDFNPVSTLQNKSFMSLASATPLSYSAEFRAYSFNNVEFLAVYNPAYDDKMHHFAEGSINPYTGNPIDSSRFTIFSLDGDNNGTGEPNIQLIDQEGGMTKDYFDGVHHAKIWNGPAVSEAEYASMIMTEEFGIVIKDPTKAGTLMMNIR